MIVHIGYHKTGTTYLQKKIFPNLKGLTFIPYASDDNLLEGLTETSSLDIDLEEIKENVHKVEEDQILYSNESLVGHPFYLTGLNKKEIADNLKKIGAKKIIITIRNQIGLLESTYKQYIQEGGVAPFNYFIGKWQYSFDLHHLNFYPLVKYYSSLFGKENVLILLIEELKNREEETIRKIEDFTNSRYVAPDIELNPKQANISISSTSISLLRIANHFVRSQHRPSNLILPNRITSWKLRFLLQRYIDPYFISKIFTTKSFIKQNVEEKLIKYYKPGNARMQKEFGVNLKKYNYPL